MRQIGIVPQVSGVGGMVSFRTRFAAGLHARGIGVTHDPDSTALDSILVIGGTRHLPGLWRAKARGVRIVQRLNGMNWLHRVMRTGVKHYVRSIYGNWNLQLIRSRIADHIVYQSEFSQQWWERVYGPTPAPCSVVHNGVDLATYAPAAQPAESTSPTYRVLLVEGSLAGGYETGLETAVNLVELLNIQHRATLKKPVELLAAGRVPDAVKARWSDKPSVPVKWAGLVPPEQIPELDRSAGLLYASDLNPACPNTVIEALACGTPVLAFDTGALPELVTGDSGRVVAYGGDPWKLDAPDIPALATAAVEILTSQPRFRTAARARAVDAFSLEHMMSGYLQALAGSA